MAHRGNTRGYSRDNYRSLLALALRRGYRFAHFLDKDSTGDRRIYLRHDVDYSLTMAVGLAEINYSLGITGTFCLLLRSQVYNLLSDWSLEQARRLRDMGQHLALHYALPRESPPGDQELASHIQTDFNTVRNYVPDIAPVFSWHNPTPRLIEWGKHFEVPELLNLYSPRFLKETTYFSDSNMRYSVDEFEAILSKRNHTKLHLLFHPFNWVAGGHSMLEVLSTTWTYVLRDCEEEIKLNRAYANALPAGMPDHVLQIFADQWLQASSKKSG